MKIKVLPGIILLLILPLFVSAQSVKITARKVNYTRPKKENFEHKNTFTITYPKVSGLSAALNKKIENTLSYERNFDFKLQEEIRELYWLEEAGYKVNYNKGDVLDVTLWLSGSGAYPSAVEKTIVVNLKTGERVTPQNVFTNLAGLAAKVKKSQQAEMRRATAEYKKDPDAADFDGGEYFRDANFTAENLKEFAVGDRGVTFIYDYGFPHVVQALQPEGRYFFSYAELKPFIRREGLLGRFVR